MKATFKSGKTITHVHGQIVRKMADLDGGGIRCAIKGTVRHFVVGNPVPIDGTTYVTRKVYNGGMPGDLYPQADGGE